MKSYRDEIDKIDEAIKKLVKKRLDAGRKIAAIKAANDKPILDLPRMKKLAAKFSDDELPYIKDELSAVINTIMSSTIHGELHDMQRNLRYGLAGRNISSSLSPKLHELFGLYEYGLFDMNNFKNSEFIQNKNFSGINITMPFKNDAFAATNIKSEYAELSNSVNTLINKSGTLYGFNTDVIGIENTLDEHTDSIKSALILGNGATSRSACIALSNKGTDKIYIANRNNKRYFKSPHISYINFKEISALKGVDVIINATPEDETMSSLIKDVSDVKLLLDMNYSSAHSDLMQVTKEMGANSINGLSPLIHQGIASFNIFCSTSLLGSLTKSEAFYHEVVKKALGNLYPNYEKIYGELMLKAYNILIIGMPGCGKSRTAKDLGQLLSKPVIDIDRKIEAHTKISNEEFIVKKGIQNFREIEESIALKTLPQNGHIIATGGGLVENKALMKSLCKRCIVIHIKTNPNDLNTLETAGRPLSKSPASISMLYEKRSPLYELYSDYTVNKDKDAALQIAKLLNFTTIKP